MRIENIEVADVIEETGQVLVRVVLVDDDGYREEFVIDLWEMMDTDKFANILHNWKTYILPMRKKVHNLVKVKGDLNTVNKFITALKDLRVEDTDTPDSIKSKILSKVQDKLNRNEHGVKSTTPP